MSNVSAIVSCLERAGQEEVSDKQCFRMVVFYPSSPCVSSVS